MKRTISRLVTLLTRAQQSRSLLALIAIATKGHCRFRDEMVLSSPRLRYCHLPLFIVTVSDIERCLLAPWSIMLRLYTALTTPSHMVTRSTLVSHVTRKKRDETMKCWRWRNGDDAKITLRNIVAFICAPLHAAAFIECYALTCYIEHIWYEEWSSLLWSLLLRWSRQCHIVGLPD